MAELQERRERQDALYADEPWAKLAVKAGFRPYDTESSARAAFRFCADELDRLTAENARLRAKLELTPENVERERYKVVQKAIAPIILSPDFRATDWESRCIEDVAIAAIKALGDE